MEWEIDLWEDVTPAIISDIAKLHSDLDLFLLNNKERNCEKN